MTATLGDVTTAWIPSAPGVGLDEDIRARLITLGVREQYLDLWSDLAQGARPYEALVQILATQAAYDHENPLKGGRTVHRWPHTMSMDDAMGWLVIFCQRSRIAPPVVRAWAEHTPHGWAFVAAGIDLPEVLGGQTWDWDTLRTMAALRGVRLPEETAGCQSLIGALSEGMTIVPS